MTARRKYNGLELFQAFDTSGLNQTQYCKQHNLNPKYFSNTRSQFLAKQAGSSFQKITVQSACHYSVATTAFVLEVGQCKVRVPSHMSVANVATLIKALA